MKRERNNPTLGKFRVTARPLDGFAAPVKVVGDDDGDHDGGYDDKTDTIILMERPSSQLYSRQGRAHSTPGTDSHTATIRISRARGGDDPGIALRPAPRTDCQIMNSMMLEAMQRKLVLPGR